MYISTLKFKLSPRLSAISVFTVAVALLLGSVSSAYAGGNGTRVWFRLLQPSTGFNTDCTAPVFQLPPEITPEVLVDFIGLHDPDAPASGPDRDAIPLTADDCVNNGDKEVATTVNQTFLNLFGLPDADTRLKNLRSNEVPVVAGADGSRSFLQAEGSTSAPLPATLSLPSAPLTLDEFRGVRGFMFLKCRADGTAKVRIDVYRYRPHELLTIWALWAFPEGLGVINAAALPFGGVPNAMIPNERGYARFVRELSYCPMDAQENGAKLMWLDIATHMDGAVNGATPDVPVLQSTFTDASDPSVNFSSVVGFGTTVQNRGIIQMAVDSID